MTTSDVTIMRPGVQTTTEKIPVRLLIRDERVQRALIAARVRRLKDDLDLDGIGVVTVSRRSNGDLVLLDGGHRCAALMEAGMGDWEITAHIYDGLSLSEEARLFRKLNNTRRSTAYDDFKVGVVEGDAECVDIDATVAKHDLKVVNQSRDKTVRAVDKLRRIYRSGGAELLSDTLGVALGAWGATSDATEGDVLHGISQVLNRYGTEIDRPALIRKLAKHPGGPLALRGDAKGLMRFNKVSAARAVALIVLDDYNRGRRHQLPPV